MMRLVLTTWLLIFSLSAQTRPLTIDMIMEGEDFVGTSPSRVWWDGDGRHIYFRWKRPDDKKAGLFVISRDGSGLRRLSDEEESQVWPRNGLWNKDRTRFVAAVEGDIYLYAPEADRRALTQTIENESNPRFSSDGSRIIFVRQGNLFSLPLQGGSLVQITDFRSGDAPTEKKDPKGNREFLVKQQEDFFEKFSKEKKKEREEESEKSKKKDKRAFYSGKNGTLSGLDPSPDGTYVAFRFNKRARDARRTSVPDYVTEDGFTADLSARSKVGEPQRKSKLGLYQVSTGDVTWIKETEDTFFSYRWNEPGDRLAVWTSSADFKDRRILTLAPGQADSVAQVDHLHDDAWIGGPGSRVFGWMPDGETLYFVSEREGWSHLYLASHDGSHLRALTEGRWEVTRVELFPDKKQWFLETSEGDLRQRHLYTMPLEGGPRVRLTQREGRHQGTLSPDGRHLAVLYSNANTPPDLYAQAVSERAPQLRLTDSRRDSFRKRVWMTPEFVEIPARDGTRVPARFYRPRHPAEGRPAVIFVHGAGYLQNAHKWWSNYYREYMFHHILAESGYHILDIDYRGSAGYGRDWRTAIYRHMGGLDLTDQVDGAKWLVDRHGVDPSKIGIYGGSYGGFITLMAMFTTPDVFRAGAALRPVTDWAHYNHFYTGRILNLPQDDAESYQRSSPIYFAEGLKGALLICHGMIDTNVHFQDTVRLAQRLIELRKENWEVAVYPLEAHGFRNATSWADEYKRIFKLFEENLK